MFVLRGLILSSFSLVFIIAWDNPRILAKPIFAND